MTITIREARCSCGRLRLLNFKTGKLWTRCAICRAKKAKTPGQQSAGRRLHMPDKASD